MNFRHLNIRFWPSKLAYSGAVVFALVLSVSQPADAGVLKGLGQACLQLLGISRSDTESLSPVDARVVDQFDDFHPERKSFSDIHPAVQTWLQTNASQAEQLAYLAKEPSRFQAGQSAFVAEREFVILSLLGHGGEGFVYLAQGPTGIVVLKTYFYSLFMEMNLRDVHQDPKLPKVLIADFSRRIMILEYHEGIPVKEILNGSPSLLSSGEIRQIQKAWENSSEQFQYDEFNVVYSLHRDEFLPFDGG